MREEEDKVGREVTTRIPYILWNIYHQDFPRWLLSRATRTRARRTSEGAKRASSRLSFPSSAAISLALFLHRHLFLLLSPIPSLSSWTLSVRQIPQEKNDGGRNVCAPCCCRAAVHGSSERKGSSHFAYFTPHVHVHLASVSYREQRRARFHSPPSPPALAPLCLLTWRSLNVL